MSSRMTIHKNHNIRCSSRVESKNRGMSETIVLENLKRAIEQHAPLIFSGLKIQVLIHKNA